MKCDTCKYVDSYREPDHMFETEFCWILYSDKLKNIKEGFSEWGINIKYIKEGG